MRWLHSLVRPVAVALIPTAVGACGGAEGESSSHWSETDSAGVALVTQRLDTTRVVELEEVWRIGSVDGDESTQFFQPWDAVFDDEGQVHILDSRNFRVKIFDAADGTFRSSWGSQGGGPGEFEQLPYLVVRADDRLLIMDGNSRVHVFHTDGTLVRTIGGTAQIPPGSFLERIVTHDGSRWLVGLRKVFDPERGEQLSDQPLSLHVLDLEEGTIGEPSGLSWSRETEPIEVAGLGIQTFPLYGQREAAWFDGSSRLYRVLGPEYAWEVFAPDGTLLRRVTVETDPVLVQDDELDRYRADQEQQCRDQPNPFCENYLAQAVPAQVEQARGQPKPAVYQFDGTPAGDLLVLRTDLGYDLRGGFQSKTYDLFDPDGRFRGRFTRPPSFRVIAMDDTRLLAVEEDELEVEQVVLYRWRDPGD